MRSVQTERTQKTMFAGFARVLHVDVKYAMSKFPEMGLQKKIWVLYQKSSGSVQKTGEESEGEDYGGDEDVPS